MINSKEVLKKIIRKTCSTQLQHRLRKYYLVRRILKNVYRKEKEIVALESIINIGDQVADIGANVGEYTIKLSSLVGKEGQVYSFEPIWGNYNILEAVVQNACLSNVRLFKQALGYKSGKQNMVIPDMEGFDGFAWAHFIQHSEPGKIETVDVFTIDELWDEKVFERLDFIKCDVEGAELEVILGGLRFLKVLHPCLLIEISKKNSEAVFELLKKLGYRVFVYDVNLIETKEYLNKRFSNYFFFHPKSEKWKLKMSKLDLI